MLTFLQDTKVGYMVSLAPPEEDVGEDEGDEKEGPGPPQDEEGEEEGRVAI